MSRDRETGPAPRTAPADLREKINVLSKSSPVLEQGIVWSPDSWRTDGLEPLRVHIDRLAESTRVQSDINSYVIRRRHVAALHDDPAALFIGAMAWGHGGNGYGPYRVGRIIANAGTSFDKKLGQQVEAAHLGPAAAWSSFTGASKLVGLGPAFASKIAYFAALGAQAPEPWPLIVDINVSWGIFDVARVVRAVERKGGYLDYVDLAHAWADDSSGRFRADEVEWALFEIGKDVRTANRKARA